MSRDHDGSSKPETAYTAELRRLLQTWGRVPYSWNALITHIDGLLAQQREAGRREGGQEAVDVFAIEVEKLLCAALGREWSVSGISIESLVAALATRQPVSEKPADYLKLLEEHVDLQKDYNKLAEKFEAAKACQPVSQLRLQRYFNSEFGVEKFSAVQHKNMPDIETYYLAADVDSAFEPGQQIGAPTDEQIGELFRAYRSSNVFDQDEWPIRFARALLAASPKVAVVEQVSDDKRDAERYRWLRDKANGARFTAPMVFLAGFDGEEISWGDALLGGDLDDHVDAAEDRTGRTPPQPINHTGDTK